MATNPDASAARQLTCGNSLHVNDVHAVEQAEPDLGNHQRARHQHENAGLGIDLFDDVLVLDLVRIVLVVHSTSPADAPARLSQRAARDSHYKSAM